MKDDQIHTLSTGIRAIVRPVPAMLVDRMVGKIKNPEVPTQYIEEKDRMEENPLDPKYLAGIDEANHRRGEVTMEAMITYGIELVDGIPDPEEWLPKLEWLAKRTGLDLSEWDLENDLDLEFVYKAFIATSGPDLMLVTIKSGMQNEEVELAMRGFRGIEAPDPDPSGES